MKLYEISQAIENLFDNADIDETTGEIIIDQDFYDYLTDKRDEKIENLIKYYKDLLGDVVKFKSEISNLQNRMRSVNNKAESLKSFLDILHKGHKAEYGVHKISYRKSTSVVGDDIAVLPTKYWKIPTPTVNKNAVKKALQNGEKFSGWSLEEKQNIQIK